VAGDGGSGGGEGALARLVRGIQEGRARRWQGDSPHSCSATCVISTSGGRPCVFVMVV